MEKLVGRVLGERYRVERLIGKGAFAAVYEAYDKHLNRRVALKMLSDTKDLTAAADEVKVVQKLRHEGIVSVYDLQRDEGTGSWFVVMELCSGGTLRDKITQGVDCRKAIRWLRDIAAAIDYAHSKGILHCDIKPENILFEGAKPRLGDFGLAKLMSQVKPSIVRGTPCYMAPEVYEGKIEKASDIYSFGLVAAEVLLGKHPVYGTADCYGLRRKLGHYCGIECARARLETFTGEELGKVLRRALAIDPAERPRTATELVDQLEQGVGRDSSRSRLLISILTTAKLHALGQKPEQEMSEARARAIPILPAGSSLLKNVLTVGIPGFLLGGLVGFLYGGVAPAFRQAPVMVPPDMDKLSTIVGPLGREMARSAALPDHMGYETKVLGETEPDSALTDANISSQHNGTNGDAVLPEDSLPVGESDKTAYEPSLPNETNLTDVVASGTVDASVNDSLDVPPHPGTGQILIYDDSGRIVPVVNEGVGGRIDIYNESGFHVGHVEEAADRINLFDEHGFIRGYAKEGATGGIDFFNELGLHVGHAQEGIGGGIDVYDQSGFPVAHVREGIGGGFDVYDQSWLHVGRIEEGPLGHMTLDMDDAGIVADFDTDFPDLDMDFDMDMGDMDFDFDADIGDFDW